MFQTVDESVKQNRLEICNSCDSLIAKLQMCKECGCYMPAKAMFASVSCPINKWPTAEAGTSIINSLEESMLNLWDNS
jgi:hypothetical protein